MKSISFLSISSSLVNSAIAFFSSFLISSTSRANILSSFSNCLCFLSRSSFFFKSSDFFFSRISNSSFNLFFLFRMLFKRLVSWLIVLLKNSNSENLFFEWGESFLSFSNDSFGVSFTNSSILSFLPLVNWSLINPVSGFKGLPFIPFMAWPLFSYLLFFLFQLFLFQVRRFLLFFRKFFFPIFLFHQVRS